MGVAGEANLIAVAAQTTPSVVNHRTAVGTVLVHFIKEHMVAPEGLTQVGSMLAGKPLLPIEPPEVHALFLFGTDNGVEKCLGEIGAVEYPLDTLRTVLGLHIFAAEHQVHVAEVFGRLIFLNTVGRMQIQCCTQARLVNVGQQPFAVGNQVGIPRPAGPAAYAFRQAAFVTVPVPVHVQNKHIGGNSVGFQIFDKTAEFISRVRLILAVPVAEHVSRRQRYVAGHACKIFESLFIIMSVAHKVNIHGLRVGAFRQPVISHGFVRLQSIRAAAVGSAALERIVDYSPA